MGRPCMRAQPEPRLERRTIFLIRSLSVLNECTIDRTFRLHENRHVCHSWKLSVKPQLLQRLGLSIASRGCRGLTEVPRRSASSPAYLRHPPFPVSILTTGSACQAQQTFDTKLQACLYYTCNRIGDNRVLSSCAVVQKSRPAPSLPQQR